MKKFLIAALVLVPTIAFAGFSSMSFRLYSSASPAATSCSILPATDIENGVMNPTEITQFNLTLNSDVITFTPANNDKYVRVSCYPVAGYDGTITTRSFVRMYLNGISNKEFPLTEIMLKVK